MSRIIFVATVTGRGYTPGMAEKRRPGRPKLSDGSRKEVVLRVRMSPALRRALDEAALAAGQTASEFVRFLLQQHLRDDSVQSGAHGS